MDSINELTNWYKAQCDGDWEHTFGIVIKTIDNPGWSLQVNILETPVEGKKCCEESIKAENDWYSIKSDGEIFKAYGDYDKLQLLIDSFLKFVQ